MLWGGKGACLVSVLRVEWGGEYVGLSGMLL